MCLLFFFFCFGYSSWILGPVLSTDTLSQGSDRYSVSVLLVWALTLNHLWLKRIKNTQSTGEWFDGCPSGTGVADSSFFHVPYPPLLHWCVRRCEKSCTAKGSFSIYASLGVVNKSDSLEKELLWVWNCTCMYVFSNKAWAENALKFHCVLFLWNGWFQIM